MSELPEGWEQVKLSDVAVFVMGQSPPSNTYNRSSLGLPFFQGKAEFGKLYPTAVKYCSQPLKVAKAEDVLISVRAPVGPTNLCPEDSCIGRGLAAICPLNSIPSRFILYYLRSIESWLSEQGTGSTFTAISKSDLEQIDVTLPPLNEQRRIVAKLEKLLGKVEACQQRLEKIPRILKRFRQAVLAAACSGRLTADWRNEHTKLLAEQRPEPNKCHLPPIAEEEVLFDIPQTWCWRRLGSLADFINGDRGKNYPNKNEYVPEGIPFINTGHIRPDGSLSLETMHFLTREKFNSLRGGKIKQGDLVYCLRGATLGKTAFVDPFTQGAIASSLVIIRLNRIVDRRFGYYFLTSPYGKELIDRFDNGSAQPNLSADAVKHYVIPLPTLSEQQEIARRVESLFKVADQLEERYRKAKAHVDKLTQSILAKAFRGELVPTEAELARREGRDYESAAALLERIRRGRAEQPQTPKATRPARKKKDDATRKMFA